MVHFVGAGDALVGVTHECDHPPGVEALPRLTSTRLDHADMTSAEIDAAIGRLLTDDGSVYALDAELLTDLAPDLVVTQGLCDVCAVSADLVERAASALESEPEVLSLNPTSLHEVLDDTVRVGEALGRGGEARAKIATLEERLARVEEAVSGLPRPRVGCIEWLDPPFSAGHWVPEMVRLAGGEELFARAGRPVAAYGVGRRLRRRPRRSGPHALRLRRRAGRRRSPPRATGAARLVRSSLRSEKIASGRWTPTLTSPDRRHGSSTGWRSWPAYSIPTPCRTHRRIQTPRVLG